MTSEEASNYLWERHRIRRSPRRLGQLRATGDGPPYQRDGLVVIYRPNLLDDWVKEHLGDPVRSTAQETVQRSEESAEPARWPRRRIDDSGSTQAATAEQIDTIEAAADSQPSQSGRPRKHT